MSVLGDQLLRQRLEALTAAYFCPSPADGTSLLHLELRAEAVERVQAAIDAKRTQEYLSALSSSTQLVTLADVKAALAALAQALWALPQSARENVPTIIFWLLVALATALYLAAGLPSLALLALVFIVPLPQGGRCPKRVERALRGVVPLGVLYPLLFDLKGRRRDRQGRAGAGAGAGADNAGTGAGTGAGAGASTGAGAGAGAGGAGLPAARSDFSGVWKRVRTENYEDFIGAQGAGFMQRKLAASIALTHTITMSADLGLFRLQENGGPICTDWTYAVGQGPDSALGGLIPGTRNPTNGGSGDRANLQAQEDLTVFQKGKEFLDTVFWTPEHVLKVVKALAPDRKYLLTVHRFLEEGKPGAGGKVMRVQAVYSEPGAGGRLVKANSWFQWEGPSPHAPPTRPSAAGAAGAGEGEEGSQFSDVASPAPQQRA